MKSFKDFINENNDFKDVDNFIIWIEKLNVPKRKPRNIKKVEHDVILGLIDMIEKYKSIMFKDEQEFNKKLIAMRMKNIRISKEELEKVYNGGDSNLIKKDIGTYIKYDTSAYDKFLVNIEKVEKFLKTLKGYHKKSLKNVKVKFVTSNEIKSSASYKTNEDTLYINNSKMGNTKDGYGSLVYVILHELGHRYLKQNNQNFNIDSPEWTTTKYSMTDSWSGEERFAELFALSHWKNKYKEYSNQINKFIEVIK